MGALTRHIQFRFADFTKSNIRALGEVDFAQGMHRNAVNGLDAAIGD